MLPSEARPKDERHVNDAADAHDRRTEERVCQVV
jgi:hypothetical protein